VPENQDTRVLRGGLLPDRPELGPVDILIDGERIAEVASAGTLNGATVTDVTGGWVLPGVIDAHVHPIHAEGFESVGNESVLGGITTALQHLYPEPGETLVRAVERATADGVRAAADFGYHIRMTPKRVSGEDGGAPLVDQLVTAARLDGVLSVKAFLAHTDPTVMSTTIDLTRILVAAATADLPVIVHAEPGDAINALESLLGVPDSLPEHDRFRSEELEASAVSLAAAIAHAADARLYVAHMSNVLAVEALRAARGRGARVRGESCTHYFFLDSGMPLGGVGRVTPPLRGAASVAAMRTRVGDAASGIDLIASDHCGYDEHEKPRAPFRDAGNGLPGADSMLPLLVDAALTGDWITPADIVRLLARGPAESFGLVGKGRLTPGFDADLVVVDPSGSTALANVPFGPATAESPYGGTTLRGAVDRVLRRGADVVVGGASTGVASGRPIRRGSPVW
jgi:dihydropyrimidinase